MSTTLGAIALPDDLQWIDEYLWTPVGQQVDVTLAGALIIEESKQLAGRLITLQGRLEGSEGFAAITRTTLEALRVLADNPLVSPITLTLQDGRTFNVRFRYGDGTTPVEAIPFKNIAPAIGSDFYFPTIRLMQV